MMRPWYDAMQYCTARQAEGRAAELLWLESNGVAVSSDINAGRRGTRHGRERENIYLARDEKEGGRYLRSSPSAPPSDTVHIMGNTEGVARNRSPI
mmetsp:Transcript_17411/g.38514  ORF Transcript_17411/g.38514 Transcript_17411/m.38514 type:complete len:96 (+) Transcript_17411:109-396(+)